MTVRRPGQIMDIKDSELLNALRQNARMPLSSLAAKLGMGRGTVRQRMSKLEKQGVIVRYTVDVDENRIGASHSAFVLISFMPGTSSQRDVADNIAAIPGIDELYLVSGSWDMIARIHAETLEGIGSIVIDRLRSVSGVSSTQTCSVFSSVKV